MTKREKLESWVSSEIEKARENGERFFLSFPDGWYEANNGKPTFCCENGHVSSMVLKSEALGGDVCLACYKPLYLTPPITETELDKILK